MYPATIEEVEIFRPGQWCWNLDRSICETIEECCLELHLANPGFSGECPDRYELKNIYGTIEVISFEHKYPYYGIFYYKDRYDEGTMLSGFLPSYKNDEANNHKAYMFRLVLCWMKQKEEKNNA